MPLENFAGKIRSSKRKFVFGRIFLYFESFAIGSSEIFRWERGVEIRNVTVEMRHNGKALVGHAEETNDGVMAASMRSTFVENVRRSITLGIRVEIDLLEDEFVLRRVDRGNIWS